MGSDMGEVKLAKNAGEIPSGSVIKLVSEIKVENTGNIKLVNKEDGG